MASHAGTTSSAVAPDKFGHLPGRTVGLGVPFRQSNLVFVDPVATYQSEAATRTAAGGAATVKVIVARAARESDAAFGFAEIWFELIHILPKTKIDFGNIITLIEDEYEIYNASRDTDASESAIINNASPGVALPNNTPTVTAERQSSMLDPTSTGQTLSALGTLVKLKVQALSDGLPTFDTNIDFEFLPPFNDVTLLVAGTRIVLIPFEYEKPITETLDFLTDRKSSLNGKRQAISTRSNPRQLYQPLYILNDNSRRRMQALLLDWLDNIWGFPVFGELLRLTGATSPGATQYQVVGADLIDIRVGGLAVVLQDERTYDVINVQAVTSTLITAADPSVNGYAVGTKIMPLRTARVNGEVRASRPPVGLQSFQIPFEVTDNDTGALAGDVTPGFWSTYDGKVLFDDCNVIRGDLSEEYSRRTFRLDNKTGNPYQFSTWDRGKRSHAKGFVLRGREQILQFRKLILGLRGPQKSFWIPTFDYDLDVVADLVSGTNTMDIDSFDYVRFVRDREPMKTLRITFTDGTFLVREIDSSATVSTTVERLTLDANWPANRTVAEIDRVQFYELATFDSDKFDIVHRRIGLAECFVPIIRVFDNI